MHSVHCAICHGYDCATKQAQLLPCCGLLSNWLAAVHVPLLPAGRGYLILAGVVLLN